MPTRPYHRQGNLDGILEIPYFEISVKGHPPFLPCLSFLHRPSPLRSATPLLGGSSQPPFARCLVVVCSALPSRRQCNFLLPGLPLGLLPQILGFRDLGIEVDLRQSHLKRVGTVSLLRRP